jgi:predicted dehydrogenase
MDKIKFAVAGLGGISQVMHLPALLKMNNVEITAVCDVDFTKAKNIAKRFNISKYYKNSAEMLSENPDIEAVIVAARTDAHREIAIQSLEAGMNVLVEKPLARNFKEAAEIVAEAEKQKKILMVGMNNRFRSDVMMQRSFIRAKEIQDVFYVKTGWLKSQNSDRKWLMDREKSGGGVILDNGIVMLDLGLWMLDFPDVHSVSAVNYYHNTKSVEDSNFSLIKFQNGASLTIEISWSLLRSKEFFYNNVYGKSGSTSINPLKVYKKLENSLLEITPKNVKAVTDTKSSYENEIKHFINVITGKDKQISTGKEALEVMQIIEAIYKSAKKGKEIIFN